MRLEVMGSQPSRAILVLNSACNLQCEHCEYWSRRPHHAVDLSAVIKFAAECRKLEITEFHVTGGEPLLHRDFRSVIKCCLEDAKLVVLSTNGVLLTQEVVEWLASLERARDRVAVNISLYDVGKTPAPRFTSRHKVWQQAVDAVLQCRTRGIHVTICTLVVPNAVEKAKEVLALSERMGLPCSFQPLLQGIGTYPPPGPQRKLSWETSYGTFWQWALEQKAQGARIQNPATQLEALVAACRGDDWPIRTRCNMVESTIVLQPDGSISPCFYLPPLCSYAELTAAEYLERRRQVWSRGCKGACSIGNCASWAPPSNSAEFRNGI